MVKEDPTPKIRYQESIKIMILQDSHAVFRSVCLLQSLYKSIPKYSVLEWSKCSSALKTCRKLAMGFFFRVTTSRGGIGLTVIG